MKEVPYWVLMTFRWRGLDNCFFLGLQGHRRAMEIWMFVTLEHKSFPFSFFDCLNDLASFLLRFLSCNNEFIVRCKKVLICIHV